MADPFTGEIRIFGFNFAPINWALCNGAQMPIQQNTVLFSIITNKFGGDGQSTFNLPNLQGQVVSHWGAAPGLTPQTWGEDFGESSVMLNYSQMPSHTHVATAGTLPTGSTQGTPAPTTSSVFSRVGQGNSAVSAYSKNDNANTPMAPMLSMQGGNQAHSTCQPYLPMNFCICLYGDYPVRP